MSWSRWFDFTPNEIANEAPTTCGVFCVAGKESPIEYPTGLSATVMLGVADDRQRGLRSVLAELAAGGHEDLERERALRGGLRFCFQANLGNNGARATHSAVLADFVRQHGSPPRCNKAL